MTVVKRKKKTVELIDTKITEKAKAILDKHNNISTRLLASKLNLEHSHANLTRLGNLLSLLGWIKISKRSWERRNSK